jgi:N-acylneuraminate cytidylyltransferase/CMP-N,N'-diacetyllegionaminic acid synthase
MKRLCSVCARGGSKGVPNKNIRPLLGKPLLIHSLDQARQSGLFDCIVVSSDSKEILQIAGEWGVDHAIERPEELATDFAPKLPVIQHCFQTAETLSGMTFYTAVDLDATSPLRNQADLKGVVDLLESNGTATTVITGTPARRSPYFNLIELDESGNVHLSGKRQNIDGTIVRRQDAQPCFDMNASIYAWWRDSLLKARHVIQSSTRLYVMPEERSVDIDSELDFRWVEFLMNEQQKNTH